MRGNLQCSAAMGNNVVMLDCPQDGWSALMVASMYGNTDVVKILLEYKAEVNLRTGVSDI